MATENDANDGWIVTNVISFELLTFSQFFTTSFIKLEKYTVDKRYRYRTPECQNTRHQFAKLIAQQQLPLFATIDRCQIIEQVESQISQLKICNAKYQHKTTMGFLGVYSLASKKSSRTCNVQATSPASKKTYTAKSMTNSIIAGYVSGIVGTLVGHPMDSLKVFMQTDSSSNSSTNRVKQNPTTAVKTGFSTPGRSHMSTNTSTAVSTEAPPRSINLRTLYAGVSGPLLTVGVLQSVNFLMYDSIRRVLHRQDHPGASNLNYLNHDSLFNVMLSALGTGTVMSVLTSPLFVVKTKQQVMTWKFQRTIRDTWRHGAKGFFVGFGPHFINETVGRAAYFGTYEVVKRHLAKEGESATLTDRMIAACSSGIVCWGIIFPFDVLRSRLYQRAILMDGNAGSAWELTKSMYQHQGGLRPFYRGFGVTVLRAGPVAAAVLPVYDTTLEWLNENNRE